MLFHRAYSVTIQFRFGVRSMRIKYTIYLRYWVSARGTFLIILCNSLFQLDRSLSLSQSFFLSFSPFLFISLNGCSTQMSSHDCFEMGRQSYLNKDYYHTSLWMNEAMARLNNNTNETTSIPKADILEYLAFSVFKQGKSSKRNEDKNAHWKWWEVTKGDS